MDKQEFIQHQFSIESILFFVVIKDIKDINKSKILKMFTKHVYWYFLAKMKFSNILSLLW